MEFFTDTTIIVYKSQCEPKKLATLCWLYKGEEQRSSCIFKGSFKQLDEIMSALKSSRNRSKSLQHPHPKGRGGHPVEVSEDVLSYIQQKYAKKLKKVLGDEFEMEIQPDQRAGRANASGAVLVTIRVPRNSSSTTEVHRDLIRQRFITFYQRTASDLQVTTLLHPQPITALERDFPLLHFLDRPHAQEVTVMGPFAHMAALTERLQQKSRGSSQSLPIRAPHGGHSQPSRAPTRAHSVRSRAPPSGAHSQPTGSVAMEEDSCAICMDVLAAKKTTLRCRHSFCSDCLKQAFKYKPVCPTCGELYGVLTGTQPRGGTMDVNTSSSPLEGYDKYATIVITYHIPSGIQEEEHPNPGRHYEGTTRRAYLPDSTEGRALLGLLQRAFDQRLVFTIGSSSTSGRTNVVTWNDIHHKTSTHGGPTNYGYPDPEYLGRLRDELKVKGIQ